MARAFPSAVHAWQGPSGPGVDGPAGRDLGFGVVRPGEVYRTLRRAEAEGLVFSEREHLGYLLSRRRYGLTESGRAYIEFLAESLRLYREEIEVFLRAYTDRPLRGAYG